MSDATLIGEHERKFKQPSDGRILPITSKIYKLADRGEGRVRIVLTGPIEALDQLIPLTEHLERSLDTPVPMLNAMRVAIQKAGERTHRYFTSKKSVVINDGRITLV